MPIKVKNPIQVETEIWKCIPEQNPPTINVRIGLIYRYIPLVNS